MSIASEISRLQTAKANMKSAIEAKGVTVSSSTTLDGYATLISSIPQEGSSGIGEFSKYQKITATPVTTAELSVSHNLGVVPKIIMLSSTQTYAGTTYIADGVFNQNCGNARSLYDADDFTTNSYTVRTNETGSSNSFVYVNNESITIRRATSARVFDTATTYTVEVYA